mmetsp:Transcript_9225/g.15746  ORF Transcript_9225/g.15746 Transcript_9225/m.15746 type:complete len:221 (+) Transcript_9225:234-896(+)
MLLPPQLLLRLLWPAYSSHFLLPQLQLLLPQRFPPQPYSPYLSRLPGKKLRRPELATSLWHFPPTSSRSFWTLHLLPPKGRLSKARDPCASHPVQQPSELHTFPCESEEDPSIRVLLVQRMSLQHHQAQPCAPRATASTPVSDLHCALLPPQGFRVQMTTLQLQFRSPQHELRSLLEFPLPSLPLQPLCPLHESHLQFHLCLLKASIQACPEPLCMDPLE